MRISKKLPTFICHSLYLNCLSINKLTKNKETLPIIVSLTSIPSRLNTLHLTIKSIFNQTVLPEKIILWLNNDLKNKIPKKLNNLQNAIFEIKFSALDSPHLKLVESLRLFPETIIITCDDDLIYRKNVISNLYETHLIHSKDIIANRAREIEFDETDKYKTYDQWKREKKNNTNHKALCPLGYCGVLYPPSSLHKDAINEELFLKLAPTADDLWFKAMSLANKTNSTRSLNEPKLPIPVPGTQKITLKKQNISKNKNDLQWEALCKRYNLKELLKK